MVSIDDPRSYMGLFKEPIIGALKFKMTENRCLENHYIAISQ